MMRLLCGQGILSIHSSSPPQLILLILAASPTPAERGEAGSTVALSRLAGLSVEAVGRSLDEMAQTVAAEYSFASRFFSTPHPTRFEGDYARMPGGRPPYVSVECWAGPKVATVLLSPLRSCLRPLSGAPPPANQRTQTPSLVRLLPFCTRHLYFPASSRVRCRTGGPQQPVQPGLSVDAFEGEEADPAGCHTWVGVGHGGIWPLFLGTNSFWLDYPAMFSIGPPLGVFTFDLKK